MKKFWGFSCTALLVVWCVIAFSPLPPFVPGEFLSSLAWQYSALLSVPCALFFLERDRKLNGPTGPATLLLPILLYYMTAQLLLVVPGFVLNFGDYPWASQIVTVESVRESGRACRPEALVGVSEYSPFSISLCTPKSFAKTLKPGDKLKLEGKAGLGGLLVLDYERS